MSAAPKLTARAVTAKLKAAGLNFTSSLDNDRFGQPKVTSSPIYYVCGALTPADTRRRRQERTERAAEALRSAGYVVEVRPESLAVTLPA